MAERGLLMEKYLLANTYEDEYQAKLVQLIDYSLWVTLAVCGISVVVVAAKIVMGYLDGNPQSEAFGLLWVMGGVFLALSATSLVSALVF